MQQRVAQQLAPRPSAQRARGHRVVDDRAHDGLHAQDEFPGSAAREQQRDASVEVGARREGGPPPGTHSERGGRASIAAAARKRPKRSANGP